MKNEIWEIQPFNDSVTGFVLLFFQHYMNATLMIFENDVVISL
jgi:hypothetical protein